MSIRTTGAPVDQTPDREETSALSDRQAVNAVQRTFYGPLFIFLHRSNINHFEASWKLLALLKQTHFVSFRPQHLCSITPTCWILFCTPLVQHLSEVVLPLQMFFFALIISSLRCSSVHLFCLWKETFHQFVMPWRCCCTVHTCVALSLFEKTRMLTS